MNNDGVPVSGKGFLSMWAQLGATGVLAFLLVYILGAVPGLPSPIRQISEAQIRLADAVKAHDQASRDAERISRLICRGVWKGVPEMQDQCGGYTGGFVR